MASSSASPRRAAPCRCCARRDLIYRGGYRVTLTLIATHPLNATRDSPRPCRAILTPSPFRLRRGPKGGPDAAPTAERVAVPRRRAKGTAMEAPSLLSTAERQLLSDWLDRLATARSLA